MEYIAEEEHISSRPRSVSSPVPCDVAGIIEKIALGKADADIAGLDLSLDALRYFNGIGKNFIRIV